MKGRPRNRRGWRETGQAAAATAAGLGLAALPFWTTLMGSWALAPWLLGQGLLALALMKWFVLLHEAGHGTLFRSRRLNRAVGGLAGFWSGIPFTGWQFVHALHHRYTGWQDLDPTTVALVPRPLGRWEAGAIDAAWRLLLPVFSLAYRWQNFWHPRRMRVLLQSPARVSAWRRSAACLLAAYAVILVAVGPLTVLALVGPALLLTLALQDFVLLGQHTHRPVDHSGGRPVRPVPAREQARFTRSVLLPAALSRWLLHFDLHEHHHCHPRVPGYDLDMLGRASPNAVHWLAWWRASRRLSGVDFLFGRTARTGLDR